MSNPTPSCAWRGRWGSKATRISANRSARRSGAAGQFSGPGALAAGLSKGGDLGGLYADMVRARSRNLEDTFANIDADTLEAAAEAIWAARQVFTLGVGVNNANASNFTYLASTGMVSSTPSRGRSPPTISPGPIRARRSDCHDLQALPPRGGRGRRLAREQGVTVIGVSDSPPARSSGAPSHGFRRGRRHAAVLSVLGVDHRLLETLLSFVIAVASERSSSGWSRFHRRRHELGIYTEEPGALNDISALPSRSARSMRATTPIRRYSRSSGRAAGPHLAIRRHASQLENPGDYVHFELWRREPVLHRGRDGVIRGFYNVCQHRAHELVSRRRQCTGVLVCPYHAWTYELTGELRAAPNIKSVTGLRPSRSA
jgi:nitrite reductase/ring-hydroxylating ferredoxin subunit